MIFLKLELGIDEKTEETYTNVKVMQGVMGEENAREIQEATNKFVRNIYKILENNVKSGKYE